jgi:hypothetical protein
MALALVAALALGGPLACSKDAPPPPADEPATVAEPAAPAAGPAEPAAKTGPAVEAHAIRLVPPVIYLDTLVTVETDGFELTPDNVVEMDFAWLLNGRPISTDNPLYFNGPEMNLVRGDRLSARARVNGMDVHSEEVTVSNTRPVLTSVRLKPEQFHVGDTLYVEATAEDKDHDYLTMLYSWTLNNVEVGTSAQLGLTLKGGDVFTVKVTPHDGYEEGQSALITRTIGNVPPEISQNFAFKVEDQVMTYQISASDPDGDPMTYGIKNQPEGMNVDANSGLVTWNIPPDYAGVASFVVVASDPSGASVEMLLQLTVKVE